ncbi:hypothetical protein AO398_00400 [Methylobacterium sp. GXS13]|nr:hypothetical protein AO398_00400 [Methylobacterium sp. GXS13]
MSAFTWPPAARARVLELYGQPDTSEASIVIVLADEFGIHVSRSAVIGIANRGTLRPARVVLTPEEKLVRSRDRKREARAAARECRPAPAWAYPGAYRPARPASAPKKPSAPRPRPVAAPKPAPTTPRPAPKLKAVVVPAVPPSLLIPLTSAGPNACRFIADDPKSGPALVCGHPVAPGSAWCPGHRMICVVPEWNRPFAWLPRRAA